MKALQIFSDEALEHSKKLTPTEVAQFLEEFRLMHAQTADHSKLISIRIPESLLKSFKIKCKASNTPYQTMIKELMKNWLSS